MRWILTVRLLLVGVARVPGFAGGTRGRTRMVAMVTVVAGSLAADAPRAARRLAVVRHLMRRVRARGAGALATRLAAAVRTPGIRGSGSAPRELSQTLRAGEDAVVSAGGSLARARGRAGPAPSGWGT